LPYAFSTRLFDTALLIALVYPILVLILPWLLWGADVTLGGEVLQAGPDPWWRIDTARAVVMGQITVLLVALALRRVAKSSRQRVFEKAADWIPLLAVAGAIAAAVAVAVAAVGAFAVAAAVAIVVAAAFILVFVLLDKDRPVVARGLAGVYWAGGVVVASVFGDPTSLNDLERLLTVFLAALPFLNALFDTISYGVTLALLRWSVRSRSGIVALLAGILDLLFALVIFAALTAAFVALISSMNTLSGGVWLDLDGLLRGLRDSPQDHLWVFLMIGSTLLPTLLHLLAALLAIQAFTPWRGLAARLVARSGSNAGAATLAPLAAGFCLAFPLVLGLGLLGALAQVEMDHLAAFGRWYLDQLLALAALIAR